METLVRDERGKEVTDNTITAAEFERRAGRGASKCWRDSIWTAGAVAGSEGPMPIGRYMERYAGSMARDDDARDTAVRDTAVRDTGSRDVGARPERTALLELADACAAAPRETSGRRAHSRERRHERRRERSRVRARRSASRSKSRSRSRSRSRTRSRSRSRSTDCSTVSMTLHARTTTIVMIRGDPPASTNLEFNVLREPTSTSTPNPNPTNDNATTVIVCFPREAG